MKSIKTAAFLKLQRQDRLPGGLADDKQPSDFDRKEIQKGEKVEREHTSDPDLPTEIAMDHLTEDGEYYSKLKKARL